jgi:hypothetical protein
MHMQRVQLYSLVPLHSVSAILSRPHGVVTPTYTNFTTNYFHSAFYIYYTQLLLVSALYPGHLQGVTSSVDVYSVYGSL